MTHLNSKDFFFLKYRGKVGTKMMLGNSWLKTKFNKEIINEQRFIGMN